MHPVLLSTNKPKKKKQKKQPQQIRKCFLCGREIKVPEMSEMGMAVCFRCGGK